MLPAAALLITSTSNAQQLAKPNTFFWSAIDPPPSGRPRTSTFTAETNVPVLTGGWTCRTSNISSMTLSATLATSGTPTLVERAELACSVGTLSASVEVVCAVAPSGVHNSTDLVLRDGGGHATRLVIGCKSTP